MGAVDGFCDEDVDYALRLNHAGVPTELHVYPGACHGFNVIAPTHRVTKQCLRDMEDWLARQFGRDALNRRASGPTAEVDLPGPERGVEAAIDVDVHTVDVGRSG